MGKSSRPIRVAACISTSSFLRLNTPRYVYTTHFTSQLINAWVVSTFRLLWIALLQTFIYKYLFENLFSVLLGICVGMTLLGHSVTPCLTFRGTAELFPTGVAPLYIPTSNLWGFQFLYILTNTYLFSGFFYYTHPIVYEMVAQWGFDLHFPNKLMILGNLSCTTGHL